MVKEGEIMTEQCGTPAYIAPEIISDKGYEGFSSDVWSAGVVLYTMVYGSVPFCAGNMAELNELIIKGKYDLKGDVSEDVKNLISKMLEVNPKKRFTIPQILCHQWFSSFEHTAPLFTDEEKAAIAKKFTYLKNARRNQGLNKENVSMESDWFIEQDIDKTQSELTKNITSRSLILAPFNTTLTSKDQKDEYICSKLKVFDKRIVKLNEKVKEADRQYEENNNYELDNGVYNIFGTGKNEDSIVNSGNSLIASIAESKRTTSSLLNSLISKPLVIDKEVVERIAELGYPSEYVIKELEESQRNYATTTYYLLLAQ